MPLVQDHYSRSSARRAPTFARVTPRAAWKLRGSTIAMGKVAMALCVALAAVTASSNAFARGTAPSVPAPPAPKSPAPPIRPPTIEQATAACFARFERAWRAGQAQGVVGCMPKKGTVRVRLLHPGVGARPIDANFGKNQALRALSSYFSQTTRRGLVRLLPKPPRPGQKPPRATPTVRKYKYTYRLRRGNTVTTHLTVQVQKTPKGWVLAAITEQKPPRKR